MGNHITYKGLELARVVRRKMQNHVLNPCHLLPPLEDIILKKYPSLNIFMTIQLFSSLPSVLDNTFHLMQKKLHLQYR